MLVLCVDNHHFLITMYTVDSIRIIQDSFDVPEDIGSVVLEVELLVLEPLQQAVMFSITTTLETAQGVVLISNRQSIAPYMV